MNIKQLFNIKNLKNKDLLDIRPFVIVFSIYSLISIWSADAVFNKQKKLKGLLKEVKILKTEYVSTRTILMSRSKRSYLLKKAQSFEFIQPTKPLTIISLKNEN